VSAAAFGLVMAGLAACHRRSESAALPSACAPDTAAASIAAVGIGALPGTYELAIAATDGPRAGQSVRGRLVLRRQDSSLIRVPFADTAVVITQPVIGGTDVDPLAVGATRMGDLASSDPPSAPGVGVYVNARSSGAITGVIIRLGSASNGRGPQAIDAGHFTLFVRRVAAGGIWGGWTSNPGAGGFVRPDARGYFCAVRLPAG